MGDTAIYLLGATNERARELKAAYFLQWQAMLWLKDRGARWYDLGGIDPEANPGGYHFKSGFGGNETMQLPIHAVIGRPLEWPRHFAGLTGIAGSRTSYRVPVKLRAANIRAGCSNGLLHRHCKLEWLGRPAKLPRLDLWGFARR